MKNIKMHETPEAPAEARMTSRQLAQLHGLDRDRMEAALVRLGLRSPQDDGSSTYPTGEVARLLAEEDRVRLVGAAELTDRFSSDGLVRQAVQEAFDELKRQWVGEHGLHEDLVAMKEAVLAKLRKSHSFQRARRAGDAWEELAAIERFEQGLQAAIRERRAAAESERDQSHQPVSAGDIGGTNERQTAE